KAQDWPGAEELATRLKKTIPPQYLDEKEREGAAELPSPEEIVMMQQELQKLTMENQELKQDKTIEVAKLKLQAYGEETKRIAAMNRNFGVEDESETRAIANIIDDSEDDIDLFI